MRTWRRIEASRGAAARSVTLKPTDCGFDPHSRRWNIYSNLYFSFLALVSRLSAVLSSATQHAMSPEFSKKWGSDCLNTTFILLCCVRDTAWSWFVFYFFIINNKAQFRIFEVSGTISLTMITYNFQPFHLPSQNIFAFEMKYYLHIARLKLSVSDH